jgi:hypothetical protein
LLRFSSYFYSFFNQCFIFIFISYLFISNDPVTDTYDLTGSTDNSTVPSSSSSSSSLALSTGTVSLCQSHFMSITIHLFDSIFLPNLRYFVPLFLFAYLSSHLSSPSLFSSHLSLLHVSFPVINFIISYPNLFSLLSPLYSSHPSIFLPSPSPSLHLFLYLYCSPCPSYANRRT